MPVGPCRAARRSKWKITALVHFRDVDCPMIREIEGGDTTSRNMGVAIDVGTTTIVAQLIDLHTGAILGLYTAITVRRDMEKTSYREWSLPAPRPAWGP